MIQKIKNNGRRRDISIVFNSISDLRTWIEKTDDCLDSGKTLRCIADSRTKCNYGSALYKFYGSENYEDADKLLSCGWERVSKKLSDRVKMISSGSVIKRRMVYDVVGQQASVPRYLQGIPTNMIRSVNVAQKNKVVKIYKNIGYSCNINADDILEESVKVLYLIDRLEKSGIRCELFTIHSSEPSKKRCMDYVDIVVKVKAAGERLNISKVAYPLCHISFLRRHMFAVFERLADIDQSGYCYDVYGYSVNRFFEDGPNVINVPNFMPDHVTDLDSVEKIKDVLKDIK